ncbi:IS110 family transposase [Gimesia maris]|uniref:IS110 family transposase n=2 Tax=Gimesia maris TaxID=122 RepID=UPI0030D7398E
MMRYIGLNVHKHFIEVCITDRKGKILERGKVNCQREVLLEFATKKLRKHDRVALEATTNTWAVVDLIRPHVKQVVVGNPMKTRAITEAKIKTDKVDAEVLAHLLRCDYLPSVWQPDEPTQTRRALLTHRNGLMSRRGRHMNRVQSMLARLMIKPPCKYLWSKTGVAWLEALELSPVDRLMLDSQLRQITQVNQELEIVDQHLVEIARTDSRARLLMTLPGVNHVVAVGLLAAIGDIERFCDGNHAASYLGLVPSTRQSGNKCYHGIITKMGYPHCRWLLTQACQHISRHTGPLRAFYRRLVKRKPRQVAIMALARKLVTIAWQMLKQNEPYRYAKPMLMAKKFTDLDRKYRQEQRRTPSAARAKAGDGLTAVYDEIGFTDSLSLDQVPDGERRMLIEKDVMMFVEELYRPVKKDKSTQSDK